MSFKNISFIKTILTVFCFFTLQNISYAYAGNITAIRFGTPVAGMHRIVLETASDMNFTISLQDNPYRLIIDIPNSTINPKASLSTSPNPIKKYKSLLQNNKDTRIVFELNTPLEIISAFALKPSAKAKPYRIVIDTKNAKYDRFISNLNTQFVRTKKDGRTAYSIVTKSISKGSVKAQKIEKLMTAFLNRHNTPPISDKPETINDIISLQKAKSTMPLPSRKPIASIYTIAIDAGHGGKDPGASNGKIREKNITLAISKELKKQLERTGRYKVFLTRDTDNFIKLRKRVNIARLAGADLFISIHADKIKRKSVRGTSIYTLSEQASDKESDKLAKRENQVDIVAGVDLTDEDEDVANILIDLAIRDTLNHSNVLAKTVLDGFKGNNLRLLKTAHRSAGFAVLKAPDIPSILIEVGFISNKQEAKLLTSPTHQRKISRAITDSIHTYFAKIEHASLH